MNREREWELARWRLREGRLFHGEERTCLKMSRGGKEQRGSRGRTTQDPADHTILKCNRMPKKTFKQRNKENHHTGFCVEKEGNSVFHSISGSWNEFSWSCRHKKKKEKKRIFKNIKLHHTEQSSVLFYESFISDLLVESQYTHTCICTGSMMNVFVCVSHS